TSEPDHVDFARFIFAERRNVQRRVEQDGGRTVRQGENLAGAVISEDIRARRQRPCCAAVDISAGDGASATGLRVLRNRRDIVRGIAQSGVESRANVTLEHSPTVVAAGLDDVDLVERRLPDVAHVELAGATIEGKTVRVA